MTKNTHKLIIEAATKLFSKYGFKKVSMDEIAEEAGVTKKTIYNNFRDKEDLIRSLLDREIGKLREMVAKIDQKKLSFTEKVREIMTLHLNYRQKSKLLRSFQKESLETRFGIANECIKTLDQTMQKDIKNKLVVALENKEINPCDPDLAAFIIYRAYLALMFEWDGQIEIEQACQDFENLLAKGLIKEK